MEEWDTLVSKRRFFLLCTYANIATMEEHAAIKVNVEAVWVLQEKYIQDMLLTEKNSEGKYTSHLSHEQ